MRYTLYYDDFEYVVDQSIDDVIKYEFSLAFGHDYAPYSSPLSEDEKGFVSRLEAEWASGRLMLSDYYTTMNPGFIEWLTEYHRQEAEDYSRALPEDPDEWWDGLSFYDKHNAMVMVNELLQDI